MQNILFRSFRSLLVTFSLTFFLGSSFGCEKKTASKPKALTSQKKATSQPLHRVLVVRRRVPKKRVVAKRPKPVDFRSYLNQPPKGFVSLKQKIPTILLHIGYHTKNNFTGAPLPGYGAPGAWMLVKAAKALAKVQAYLKNRGLGLLIYDAYRPKRGTLGMVAWAKREGKLYLFRKGYIARRSGHNHGHTVDLTIVDLKTKKPLDMGTPWDTLNTQSHTRNAKGKALKNRMLLRRVMLRYGFRPYYKEWWHFRFRMKRTRPRDVPYGCYEAPEKRWTPQKGWSKKGFKMPMKWTPSPCR